MGFSGMNQLPKGQDKLEEGIMALPGKALNSLTVGSLCIEPDLIKCPHIPSCYASFRSVAVARSTRCCGLRRPCPPRCQAHWS